MQADQNFLGSHNASPCPEKHRACNARVTRAAPAHTPSLRDDRRRTAVTHRPMHPLYITPDDLHIANLPGVGKLSNKYFAAHRINYIIRAHVSIYLCTYIFFI